MYSNPTNYVSQNKRAIHPNDKSNLPTNLIQLPINNPNLIIPQYGFIHPINKNPIPSGYNPNYIRPPQINSAYPQPNIRVSPPNQDENLIQPQQHLKQNTQNKVYIQSPMINTNIVNKEYKQIPIQKNMISYDPVIISSQNTNKGKYQQVYALNEPNINIQENYLNKNQTNSGNNLTEQKIIDSLIRNSRIQKGKNEAMLGHPPIPMKLAIEAMKSICKISYHSNNGIISGTGFFMKYSDSLKLLITNYHVISPALMNNNIIIEIWNNKKMILKLNERYTKFLDLPKDITAIEIRNTDEIYKDILFLNYVLNYYNKGYNIYKDKYIFSIEHPLGQDAAAASGKIIDIYYF